MIEIIISLVIVGVILTFAMPAFFNAKRKGIDKEAHAMLAKIKEAQEAYRLEQETYTVCPVAPATTCDGVLGLTLPTNNWAYSVTAAGATTFTAQATGIRGTKNTWQIDESARKAF